MSNIRIGDYLNHPDPGVRLAAEAAQRALAALLRAIKDVAVFDTDGTPTGSLPDEDFDDDADGPTPDDDMPGAVTPRRAKPLTGRGRAKDIRSWARANGYSVGSMGRIPADVAAAYHAAHSTRRG